MIKKDIIQPINDLIEKQAKELKNKIAYADETEKISYETRFPRVFRLPSKVDDSFLSCVHLGNAIYLP